MRSALLLLLSLRVIATPVSACQPGNRIDLSNLLSPEVHVVALVLNRGVVLIPYL